MIALSSDGRLFGLNAQYLFDIGAFLVNIFIFLLFAI